MGGWGWVGGGCWVGVGGGVDSYKRSYPLLVRASKRSEVPLDSEQHPPDLRGRALPRAQLFVHRALPQPQRHPAAAVSAAAKVWPRRGFWGGSANSGFLTHFVSALHPFWEDHPSGKQRFGQFGPFSDSGSEEDYNGGLLVGFCCHHSGGCQSQNLDYLGFIHAKIIGPVLGWSLYTLILNGEQPPKWSEFKAKLILMSTKGWTVSVSNLLKK